MIDPEPVRPTSGNPARLPFDCLCTGIIVADHVCEPIDHVPRAGELVLTERTRLTIGGCAANVAVGLTKLGRRTAVVGRVGDDYLGRFVSESLRGSGVDCRYLAERPGEATSCSLIVNVRNEDRRFIHARGVNGRLAGDEISPELLRQTRIIYVGGYCLSEQPAPAKIAALFRSARERGVKTVLDVVIPERNNYWPFLKDVLPWCDVFLPNADEAEIITGETNPARQAQRFRDAGAATVVITCGSQGCMVNSSEGTFRLDPFAIEYVDGTGSGDAFAAGYIHGLLGNDGVLECVRKGSALGASCVRALGATAGNFNESQLAAFLQTHAGQVARSIAD